MNSVFFADAHVLGLVGGVLHRHRSFRLSNIMAARLSQVWASRNFNHRRIGRKLVGALFFLGGVVYVHCSLTFVVAHFRNAAEAGKALGRGCRSRDAKNIQVNPLGLESIDAWIFSGCSEYWRQIVVWLENLCLREIPIPAMGECGEKMREAREAYAHSNRRRNRYALTETRDEVGGQSPDRRSSNMPRRRFSDRRNRRPMNWPSLRGQLDLIPRNSGIEKVNLLLTIYRNANHGESNNTDFQSNIHQGNFHFDSYEAGLATRRTRTRLMQRGDKSNSTRAIVNRCNRPYL